MKNFISKHSTQAAYTSAYSTFDKPHVAFIEELAATGGMYYIEDAVDLVAAYVGVSAKVYNVGDILWSDGQATSTVRPTSDGATPIGICCIASDAATPGDGKARFMGLKYLTSSGPSTTPIYDLTWGPTDTSVPNIHSGYSYKDTDYDGTGNTAAIVATGNLSSYPAAYQCQQYAPSGTNAGDWFLPALQELKWMCWNKSTKVSQLTALQTDYSSDCISDISTYNLYYSSNESTTAKAYTMNQLNANIVEFEKCGKAYVIPMLALTSSGTVADFSHIYSDSNKTTEISTPDADVIYKVSDGTNITYMKWNGSTYEAATFDTKKKYIDGNTKYRWNGTALVAI